MTNAILLRKPDAGKVNVKTLLRSMLFLFMPFLATAAMCIDPVSIETETVGDYTWTYSIKDGEATIGSGDSWRAAVTPAPVGTVSIPAELGGCPVTKIGGYAFCYCYNLESIEIPSGITSVGDYAFGNCNSLASVKIPASVTSMGCAFSYCWNLTAVTVDAGNPAFCVEDGILYDKSKKTLLFCPRDKKSVTVLSGVECIGAYSFQNCSSLSLTLPSSVKSIGESAFEYCWGLDLELPSGLVEIGDYAFDECCFSSDAVVLPSSLERIGVRAFLCADSLRSISIPANVESIGEGAFESCRDLTEILVDEGNQDYCSVDGVLYDKSCTMLLQCPAGKVGTVNVPSSVWDISESAFENCDWLDEISVDAENEDYSSEDGILYDKAKTWLIRCPGGKAGAVTIPSGVEGVGYRAFAECYGVTEVTMPSGLTHIDGWAFESCSALKSVTIPASVTYIGEYAFSYECESLTTVYVDVGDAGRVRGLIEESDPYLALEGLVYVERADASIVISPEVLSDVKGGEPYSVTLTATGGTEPYVWSVRADGAASNDDYVEAREASTFSESGEAQDWSGDDACWTLDLPFAFPFYGRIYSLAYINSNGTLAFDGSFDDYSADEETFVERTLIAPMWDDLFTDEVYVDEGDDFVTIRWIGADLSSKEEVNFSATLYEDGTIRMSYGTGNVNGGLIGISAGDGKRYQFGSCSGFRLMDEVEDIVFSTPSSSVCFGLPEGLSLSSGGVLSGTPTVAASNVFTVVATDAEGKFNYRQYALVVHGDYTVTFDLGDCGVRTGGGALTQEVVAGEAAVAPDVTARPGWAFDGWDVDFDEVESDLKVRAKYVEAAYPDGRYALEIDGVIWRFSVYDGEATVERGVQPVPDGALVIPAELGGCPVTGIGVSAFDNEYADMSGLTSVTIPKGVRLIGDWAFLGCANLKHVIYKGNKDDIEFGDDVFYGTPYWDGWEVPVLVVEDDVIVGIDYEMVLEGDGCVVDGVLQIPDEVTAIAPWALADLTEVESVVIPSSVREIGDYGFGWCANLADVTFEDAEERLVSALAFAGTPWKLANGGWLVPEMSVDAQGVLHVEGRTVSSGECFELGVCDGVLTVPDGAVTIPEDAFCLSFDVKIESVKCPSTVTAIGARALAGCPFLAELALRNPQIGIASDAFGDDARKIENMAVNLTGIMIGGWKLTAREGATALDPDTFDTVAEAFSVGAGYVATPISKSVECGVGKVSTFDMPDAFGGGTATLAGVSDVVWNDFKKCAYMGNGEGEVDSCWCLTYEDIVDAEKTAAPDADDSACYTMTMFNMLYWGGWIPQSQFPTVDDLADLIRGGGCFDISDLVDDLGLEEGEYENAFEVKTGWDQYDFDEFIVRHLKDGNALVELEWGDGFHAITCCGYVVDDSKEMGEEGYLKGLFIIDSDNDVYNGEGGRTAPNRITYCPVYYDDGDYFIANVWGCEWGSVSCWRAIWARGVPHVYHPFALTVDGTTVTGFKGQLPKELEIPEGVTRIEESAFDCDYFGNAVFALESVTIPASVESMGSYVFYGCDNLSEVRFMGESPEGAEEADVLDNESVRVYYPQKYAEQYSWVPDENFGGYTDDADEESVVVPAEVTGDDPVAVPKTWVTETLDADFGEGTAAKFTQIYGSDLLGALKRKNGKTAADGSDMYVWQDFVAGTDPTDAASKFTVSIEMENGSPVVSWSPALNGERVRHGVRDYEVLGCNELHGDWSVVLDAQMKDYRFFKVKVSMPQD